MVHRFKIITVTHKKINLKQLGQFAIAGEPAEALAGLRRQFGLDELFYLSTCNRVLYFFVDDRPLDLDFALEFLSHANPAMQEVTEGELVKTVILLEGLEAISHLFEVASSMDSLVVGERQILRQLREAFEQCREWGLTGAWTQLAFQQAQLAAKKIYSSTRIGEKPVSVVSLSMQELLRQNSSKDTRILLIGAGQTNSLVAKFLVKHEFHNISVFNRTPSKARQLANFVGGKGFGLSELDEYQEGFDCLIVCTGSRDAVITPERYARFLQGEAGRKTIIDLSIPHNVHPDVVSDFPVHYTEMESLRQLAKENLAFREKEVQVAREELKSLLIEFPQHLQQRRLELAMRQVPEQIKSVRSKAMNEVFRKDMEGLDDSTRQLISRMMEYMEKKCIGIPMRVARKTVLSDS